MSKYAPIKEYLSAQNREFVRMTFSEIEAVLGLNLPASKKYPAWWSNSPSNNPMTRKWLEAGYETEQVDTASGRLVFRRRDGRGNAGPQVGNGDNSTRTTRPPVFGSMKATIIVIEGTDLTAPTQPEWGMDPRLHG